MRLKLMAILFLAVLATVGCSAQDWPSLWKGYVAGFMDNQARVIDHDQGDRTTSEGQAYGMFFALVANDRTRFNELLHWTEQNLAQNDMSGHLPAWLWGETKNHQWGVLDSNSAADADIWMAYTLLEAGRAWNDPDYTKLGMAMARRIAAEEVTEVPGFGVTVVPGQRGFDRNGSYRMNASYVPLQLVLGLSHFMPGGPWKQVAATIPTLLSDSAPHGFATDWIDFNANGAPRPSSSSMMRAARV